jgi:hypothetical protein
LLGFAGGRAKERLNSSSSLRMRPSRGETGAYIPAPFLRVISVMHVKRHLHLHLHTISWPHARLTRASPLLLSQHVYFNLHSYKPHPDYNPGLKTPQKPERCTTKQHHPGIPHPFVGVPSRPIAMPVVGGSPEIAHILPRPRPLGSGRFYHSPPFCSCKGRSWLPGCFADFFCRLPRKDPLVGTPLTANSCECSIFEEEVLTRSQTVARGPRRTLHSPSYIIRSALYPADGAGFSPVSCFSIVHAFEAWYTYL